MVAGCVDECVVSHNEEEEVDRPFQIVLTGSTESGNTSLKYTFPQVSSHRFLRCTNMDILFLTLSSLAH